VSATAKAPSLHHVNIKTTRLEDMTKFYANLAEMEVIFSSPDISFLSNDGANHRIALISPAGLKEDPDKLTRTGMHHCAFEYETIEQLVDAYERLGADGIVPHMVIDHGMTMSFYYVDPDGNSVELQCDSHGDWRSSTEWMTTSPDFAANPLGVPMDPDKLAAACHHGAGLAELHERAYAGEFVPEEPMDPRLPAPLS
jgi:catechol 2,3-dioxygenase